MDIYARIYEKNKELIDKAISEMKKCENDPVHFIGHINDVVNYTKELLGKIPADKEICIIAAYWHDVGRTILNKGHEEESGRMLIEEMQKLNYDKEMIEKCYSAVVNHKRSSNPPTVEGQIIRDADKLAYIGKERWERCINEDYTALNEIIEMLPILKSEILRLDYSKELFDRDMNLYINDYLKLIELKKKENINNE